MHSNKALSFKYFYNDNNTSNNFLSKLFTYDNYISNKV